jgi:predicted aspartyl protease
MGRVTTRLTITNRADEILAQAGVINSDAVRSITRDDVLVDSGATTLCLPSDTIAALGLQPLRQLTAEAATGSRTVRVFQDAKLSLLGREGTFDCVELPEGRTPLLGQIPLEFLGAEPDLEK